MTTKKIRNGAVTKSKLAAGVSGGPVAFAAVNSDGTLVSDTQIPGGNFNITQAQVLKDGTGLYCFKVPGVRSAVANVSNGPGGFHSGVATIAIGEGDTGCPSGQGYTASVQTSAEAGGALGDTDSSFFVWFE